MDSVEMEQINCNLCGSTNYSVLLELYDYRFGRKNHCTSFVVCKECGLVFQNPQPKLAEIEAHYPSEYEPFQPKTKYKSNSYISTKILQYGIKKRSRFITKYKDGRRLLEIGCSTGEFLNTMVQTNEWEVHGLEINPGAAEIARQQYGLNIITGTLDQANYQSSFFDAIALWDVLEHLHDPIGSLKDIHRIMKPDGLLVLRVPNLDSWDAKLFGKFWAGLDAPRHLYVFNPKTISRILEKIGFSVQEMSCEIGSYASFVLSIRFLYYGIGIKPSTSRKLLNIMTHPFMRMITFPYFFAIGKSRKGPELTVVASKME